MILSHVLTVQLPLLFLLTPNIKGYSTIPFDLMSETTTTFKTSIISSFPCCPSYTKWDDSPPFLATLAASSPDPATEKICWMLRHYPLGLGETKE